MMVSPKEMRSGVVSLGDDGIIRAKLKPQIQFGLEDAREAMRLVSELGQGKPRPILVDMTEIMAMDREARVYFASEDTAKLESAAALLIRSPLTRAIGNFFMGLNKPFIPTRLFTSEDEALAWLKGFVR